MDQFPADAPESLQSFVDTARTAGASVQLLQSNGGFSNWVIVFPDFLLKLRQENSRWLLTLETTGISELPVSFWRQALAGSQELPEATSLEDDIGFLTHNLGVVARRADELEPKLRALDQAYRAAMRAKYT